MNADTGALRIGEFARRVGVSPELLRAWERRYGLLQPIRSDGGFRLYTTEDSERVAHMRRALDEGLSAAEAARRALTTASPAEGRLEDARDRIATAIHAYDEPSIHTVLDAAFAQFSLETVLEELVLPVLGEIGDAWESGELEVAQEHFAINVLRERLLGLSRHWGRGGGPLAILACAPGERHDIGLIAFGLVLRSHGWRILFLGADTPLETVARAAEATEPKLVVISGTTEATLGAARQGIKQLARTVPLILSGAGASEELSRTMGVERLNGDLIAAASVVAARA